MTQTRARNGDSAIKNNHIKKETHDEKGEEGRNKKHQRNNKNKNGEKFGGEKGRGGGGRGQSCCGVETPNGKKHRHTVHAVVCDV